MIARMGYPVTVYRPVPAKVGAASVTDSWDTVASAVKMMFGTMTQERQQAVFGLAVDDAVTAAYPFTVASLAPEDRVLVGAGPFAAQTFRIVALRTHAGPLSVQHREALMIGSTEAFP